MINKQVWPKSFLFNILLASAITFLCLSNSASANQESLDLKFSNSLKAMKFSKDLKIRGIRLYKGVYMGHAKVGGKYGFGIIVNRETYAWGFNNRGISISKRF